MRNHWYTYENNFRTKKNFLKYLIRSQNVKFVDFYNEHPYSNMILEYSTEKIQFFLANRPPIGLKDAESSWKTTENPSVLKYIFLLPRYIDSSISAECLKVKSVIFAFWLLIIDSEKCFGIWKLFSYVFRSFCIRFFFIRNCFVWNIIF